MVEGVSGLPADEIMRLVANAWDNGADRSVKDSLHGDGETIATPPDQGDFQTYQNAMPVLPPEYTDIAEEGVRGGPYADLRIPRRRDYAPTVLGEPASGAENRASISGAGSQIGASVSVSGASQSVPAAADTGLVFQPGDRVHYWSETHNQWMEATVKSLNYDREGRPHTYDLNVKRGAQASRIRRWSAALEEQLEAMAMARDADSAMNGIQATDMNPPDAGALGYSVAAGNGASELADGPTSGVSVCVSGAPDPPEGDAGTGGSGVGDCDATLSSFAPGDKVEYWSDTYSQWMQAVVKRIRENGSTYDLDVKKGAHRRKMRRIPTGASVVTLPQAAAGYEAPANFPHARSNESSPNQMLHKALFEQALPVAAPAAEPGLGATPPSLSLACASSCGGCTSCAGASAAVPASNAASHTRRPSPFSGQQVQRNGATSAVRGTSVPEIPAPGQQQENSSPFRVSIGGSAPRAAASLQAVGARQKKDVQLPIYGQSGAQVGSLVSGSLAAAGATPVAHKANYSFSTSPNGAHQGINGRAAVTPTAATPTAGAAASAASVVAASTAATAGTSPVRGGYPHTSGNGTPPAGSTVRATKATTITTSSGATALKAAGGITPTGEKVVVRQIVQAADGTSASRLVGASFCMPETVPSRHMPDNSVSPVPSGRTSVASTAGHRVSAATTISTASPTNGVHLAAAAVAAAGQSRSNDLLEELHIGDGAFNPMQPSIRQQLVAKLGLAASTSVEEMTGFRGGLNDGVWFLSDPAQGSARGGGGAELVLKLVRCHRIASAVLTEVENFLKLKAEHPSIVSDPQVAFPCKMFTCLDSSGAKRHDLIVMRKVRGERLAELIAHKWYGNQVSQLMRVFEKLGFSLGEFHARYGNKQHGDCQPSNIFYDEAHDQVSFIDVGGMGVPTFENDQQHFQKSLNMLSSSYGQRLTVDGMHHLELGYARSKAKRPGR